MFAKFVNTFNCELTTFTSFKTEWTCYNTDSQSA